MGFFDRLKKGLTKTQHVLVRGIDDVMARHDRIDEDFYDDLEEIMLRGDIGVRTTEAILDELRDNVREKRIRQPKDCADILIDSIRSRMQVTDDDYRFEREKSAVLVIGVNGAGKTTSVGKLASMYRKQHKKVILAAADTYRAAANEQLSEWANRAGVQMISGQDGADPGSVVYDAIAATKARNADILLIDTAGRLHNKKNLMNELHKLYRILEKEYPDAIRETLLVLDGTTGQNALIQAKEFSEAAQVTGVILTKLDGTSKGGIAIAVQSELGIPVKYIGVGEKLEDMQRFDADEFVNALFNQPQSTK
ncbi:MAG: signal recognition particle-docking protein FtsY [Clostridiales bacterium]|uniref:signal recognition particle-docking protein FtsY n=1 Tax=Chordicoccus furentiruminis TaxID=2709410 RepID=UPI0023A82825|nr:signal recognition particle-docking protein FtsY [Chordicoccus furentiruminis]MCI6174142.1 signal recognition particle-docking protein FtsY [Clostridiales bacterium]